MKKNQLFSIMFFGVAVVLLLIQIFVAQYHTNHGHQVIWQIRDSKMENSKKVFNSMCFIFPLQNTAIEKTECKIPFSKKFDFPVSGSMSINSAQVVTSQIHDSLGSICTALIEEKAYDYDHTSFSTFATQYSLAKPETKIEALVNAFASPEYGSKNFEHSIQIGNYEPGNTAIAQARLDNLFTNLTKDSAQFHVQYTKGSAIELQLKDENEVKAVMADHSILNNMRYAEIQGMMTGEHIVVTPFSLPILPFVYAGILCLLIPFFGRVSRPKNSVPKVHFSMSSLKWRPTTPYTSKEIAHACQVSFEKMREEFYNRNIFGFLLVGCLFYVLSMSWGCRGLLASAIIMAMIVTWSLLKRYNAVSYVRVPDEGEQKVKIKKDAGYWIALIIAIVLVTAIGCVVICFTVQLAIDHEFWRWIYAAVIGLIATQKVYFYREVIGDWYERNFMTQKKMQLE